MRHHQMICLNGIDTTNKLTSAAHSNKRDRTLKTQELRKVYEKRGKGWVNLNLSHNGIEAAQKKMLVQMGLFASKRRPMTTNGYHPTQPTRPFEKRVSTRLRPKLLTDASSSGKNELFAYQHSTFEAKANFLKNRHCLHERLSHQPRVNDSISKLHYVPKHHTGSRIHHRDVFVSPLKKAVPVVPASSLSKKLTEGSSENPEASVDEMQTRMSLLNQKHKYIQTLKSKQQADDSEKKEARFTANQMKQYLATWKTVLPELFAVVSATSNPHSKIDKLHLLQARLKACLSHRLSHDSHSPPSPAELMEQNLFLMDSVQEAIENGILQLQKSISEDEQVKNIFGGA